MTEDNQAKAVQLNKEREEKKAIASQKNQQRITNKENNVKMTVQKKLKREEDTRAMAWQKANKTW